jgi:hypothetical protein
MRAETERQTVRMVRVLRPQEKDDGAFDLEFWDRVGAEGRFAAAWDMISEVSTLRGEDAGEPRLQRSVLRLRRR